MLERLAAAYDLIMLTRASISCISFSHLHNQLRFLAFSNQFSSSSPSLTVGAPVPDMVVCHLRKYAWHETTVGLTPTHGETDVTGNTTNKQTRKEKY